MFLKILSRLLATNEHSYRETTGPGTTCSLEPKKSADHPWYIEQSVPLGDYAPRNEVLAILASHNSTGLLPEESADHDYEELRIQRGSDHASDVPFLANRDDFCCGDSTAWIESLRLLLNQSNLDAAG